MLYIARWGVAEGLLFAKPSEPYSLALLAPLSSSSGHGNSNCGEELPQIDPLNMEASVERKQIIGFLGLFNK